MHKINIMNPSPIVGGGNFRISSENNLHKGGYYHG